MSDLWYGTSGPHDAEIVIVGEAWGREEAIERRPFVGESGQELTRILAEAGINRDHCLMLNVIAARPDNNEMWRFFYPHFKDQKAPPESLLRGLHPTPQLRSALNVLYEQIYSHERKLVITAGNYPLWALTSITGSNPGGKKTGGRRTPSGIGNWRGSMWHARTHPSADSSSPNRGIQLLPIIHPAAILRDWNDRAVTVHDLKARVPMALRGDWRPNPAPLFYAPPTFEQAKARLETWLMQARAAGLRLVCDIETSKTLITVIGMTDSTHFAMAIPMVKKTPLGLDSFWPIEQEATLCNLIIKLLGHPNVQVEGQNFIYDTQYFQHWLGVKPSLNFDTMVAQNLLFPGTPKGLDYLSSLYCRYHWYWKEDGKEWDTKGTLEELLVYNCWDLVRTYECATTQRSLIKQFNQQTQWDIKLKINNLCLEMMNRGTRIDTARRLTTRMELLEKLGELEKELLYIVPQDMVAPDAKTPWYRSDTQMRTLFYEILNMRVVNNRKTGQPTVGKEALNDLSKRNPEWKGLFERLRLYNSADHTATVLNSGLDRDNRMRCSFNPAGTETHRLSSSKNAFGRGTNLQNLTKGKED